MRLCRFNAAKRPGPALAQANTEPIHLLKEKNFQKSIDILPAPWYNIYSKGVDKYGRYPSTNYYQA